jgi:hypothetical protein
VLSCRRADRAESERNGTDFTSRVQLLMAGVALTQQHLELHFPGRLDRRAIIDSYLQEQKRHALIFANEGRELALSWKGNPRTPERLVRGDNSVPQTETYGFGTPVLKPRVSHRQPDDAKGTSPIGASRPRRKDSESRNCGGKTATHSVLKSNQTQKLSSRRSNDESGLKQPLAHATAGTKKLSKKRAVSNEASDHERDARALKFTSCLSISFLKGGVQAWRNVANESAQSVP